MTGPAQTEERLSEVRFLTVAEVAVFSVGHGGGLAAGRVGRSVRVPGHAGHGYLGGAFSQAAWPGSLGRGRFGSLRTGPVRWCGWFPAARSRRDAVQFGCGGCL